MEYELWLRQISSILGTRSLPTVFFERLAQPCPSSCSSWSASLPFLRLPLCLPRRPLLRGLRSWWATQRCLSLIRGPTTIDHYDANAVHGLTFRKQIEATQWSRKKGVAGKDPLNIPVQEFLFHGVSDWRLRALSHGKFFSVVPVASVAEAVFMAQVLKLVRERKV